MPNDFFSSLTIADILGFAVTILGIWLVVRQLKEAKLASQMEGVLMLQDHWEHIISDRTLLWEMTLQDDEWDACSPKIAYKKVFKDKAATESFMRVANFFDNLGMLVHGKALDKYFAYRGYGTILTVFYDKLEKVIALDRKVQNNPKIFRNWEWMRKEFKRMER